MNEREALEEHLDGEQFYVTAGVLAKGGRPADALEFLREALHRNYCSYPAVERDPMMESVRRLPQYPEFRARSKECHERFAPAIRN